MSEACSQRRRAIRRYYLPTCGPEDWGRGLADRGKQWQPGHSAKALAYCWEEAQGFPREVGELFSGSAATEFQGIELLLAFPEHRVGLPGGGHASQSDLFILARAGGGLVVITVEGKAGEPFGPRLRQWRSRQSEGKVKRLRFLQEQLGLAGPLCGDVRYQLIHRASSAILEARRFCARAAVMMVHSFCDNAKAFCDYQEFLGLFGQQSQPGRLVRLIETQGVSLYSGWVNGNARYLKV
jgi:hypothetical protein